jgi:hypothetical protein
MKFSFIGFLACLFLISVLMVSCSKKTNSSQGSNMNMTLLTSAAWTYDTAGIGDDSSGTIVTGLPPGILQQCQKEDTLYFYNNGTGAENSGPLKCDSTSPESTPFTWSFNNSETAITSSDSLFAGFGGSITITSLTSTQLHLLKVVTVQTIPFIVDIYLKH